MYFFFFTIENVCPGVNMLAVSKVVPTQSTQSPHVSNINRQLPLSARYGVGYGKLLTW